jgi:aminomethyltransferase
MEHTLKKTALYDACLAAGGKMVDFHGWLLPVQYESIISEHKAVREAAGVFDVSHMGQVFFEGPDAHKFLQTVTTNNFKTIPAAGAYAHVLNNDGGIIDDVIAFCLTPEKFLVVINSATREKDVNWFKEVTCDMPFSQQHNLAITGGTETFSHRTTLFAKYWFLPEICSIRYLLKGRWPYRQKKFLLLSGNFRHYVRENQ